jgi:hypothetical protein
MGILFHLGICLVPVATNFHLIGQEGSAILLEVRLARLIPQFSCPFFFISRMTVVSKFNLRISARRASASSRSLPSAWVKAKSHQQSQHSAQPIFAFVRQLGGQISVAHVRLLLGSGVALALRIQAHTSLLRTLRRMLYWLQPAQAQFFMGSFHPFCDAASSSRSGSS